MTEVSPGADGVRVAVAIRVHLDRSTVGDRGGHYDDGHAGLTEAVGAILRATPTCAVAMKTQGLALAPRATRADFTTLRTCDGLVDALETEGVAAPAVGHDPGLHATRGD